MTASADAAMAFRGEAYNVINVSIDHDRVGRRGGVATAPLATGEQVSIDHDRVGRRGEIYLLTNRHVTHVSIDHDRVGRRGCRPRKPCNERHLVMRLRVRA